MAKIQKISNNLVIGLMALTAIAFVSVGFVTAFSGGSTSTVFEGDCVNCTIEASGETLGGFGAVGFTDGDVTNLTDLDISDEFRVQGESDLQGTTTIGFIKASDLTSSSTLNFDKGATTTPGGLFNIQNTGEDKVCSRVHLKITTGSVSAGALGVGSSFVFSVTTSTGILGTGSDIGATLIASTTIPTSTAPVFDSVSDKGGNIGTAGESFIWAAGEYILGQFDDAGLTNAGSTKTDFSTSSDAYTGMEGSVVVHCVAI